VGIGSVLDEKPDDLTLPAVDGTTQRHLLLGVAGVNGSAMVEQCRRYRNVAPACGWVQRRPPGGTACAICGGACCEEQASHISRRGAAERGVTLRLLGIGIGPRANKHPRQLGRASPVVAEAGGFITRRGRRDQDRHRVQDTGTLRLLSSSRESPAESKP
jgi:hypothetical protein